MIVTRFAPSPTGRLHVGNVRTALLNWLLARKSGGRFLLRLDDTDQARSTEEFAQSIRDDLAWLGMAPDAEERQSDRLPRYEAVLAQLAAAGHAYRAYETPEELELKRKVQLGRGLPPVYDRAALALTEADHARFAEKGIAPHWRFRLSADLPHQWDDLVRGPSHIDPASLSDPVIRRADGSWLYMLPSVIDDIDMGVTHVVRGEDHVTNTGIQLQMFAALAALGIRGPTGEAALGIRGPTGEAALGIRGPTGEAALGIRGPKGEAATAPRFGHAALLTGTDGALSKRLGSVGVAAFREQGIEPIAVKALLARLGTSQPVEPVADDAPLIAGFDIGHLGRATARFDEADLLRLNSAILHQLPHAAVADRIQLSEPAWNAVRGNITRLSDTDAWAEVIAGPLPPPTLEAEDRAYVAQAARVLADIAFGQDAWPQLTEALKADTGRRGKALFMPLRRALTGLDHGPDMAALLPLIGRDAAVARLQAAAGMPTA